MKCLHAGIVAGSLLIGAVLMHRATVPSQPVAAWQVYFSPKEGGTDAAPKGGCTDAAVAAIGAAKKEIRVQAYSFTSRPIADALVEAFRRGVSVWVILDGQQTGEKSLGAYLKSFGIEVRFDHKHAIAHNKLIIIDGHLVIGGSFNYSAAAELHNAENMTFLDSPAITTKFLENWKHHAEHSEP